jgi:hypothetical protein
MIERMQADLYRKSLTNDLLNCHKFHFASSECTSPKPEPIKALSKLVRVWLTVNIQCMVLVHVFDWLSGCIVPV